MDSHRVFAPLRCPRCERFVVEPCYPRVQLCSECDVDCRSPFVYSLLRQRLRREPDPDMVATIAGYVATYRIRRIRTYFLWEVLMQPSGADRMSRALQIRELTYHFGLRREGHVDTDKVVETLTSFL